MKSFRQDAFNQDWILTGDRQKAKVEFGAMDFPLMIIVLWAHLHVTVDCTRNLALLLPVLLFPKLFLVLSNDLFLRANNGEEYGEDHW